MDKEINVNNFPQSSRISVREERLFQKNMPPLVLEKEAQAPVSPATHTYVLVILISGNVPLPEGFISLGQLGFFSTNKIREGNSERCITADHGLTFIPAITTLIKERSFP